jgi:acetamidase/formamidase
MIRVCTGPAVVGDRTRRPADRPVRVPVFDGTEPANQQTIWSSATPAIGTVRPGIPFRVRIPDSSTGQLTARSTSSDLARLDLDRVDAAVGPLAVAGAHAGDRLDVHLRRIQPAAWGWSGVFREFGLLQGRFDDDLQLWKVGPRSARPVGGFVPHVQIPTRPMLGWVGVAPGSGRHPMIPPRRTGGNLDHRSVGVGATLSLPVETDLAMLSVGDPHAAQGDGEVCGTGIETAAEVELVVHVVRAAAPRHPFLHAPAPAGHPGPVTTALGVGPDLREAMVEALDGLLDLLEARGLERRAAYLLVSVAGELRITEAVDMPNYVVAASYPDRLVPRRTNVKRRRTTAPGRNEAR